MNKIEMNFGDFEVRAVKSVQVDSGYSVRIGNLYYKNKNIGVVREQLYKEEQVFLPNDVVSESEYDRIFAQLEETILKQLDAVKHYYVNIERILLWLLKIAWVKKECKIRNKLYVEVIYTDDRGVNSSTETFVNTTNLGYKNNPIKNDMVYANLTQHMNIVTLITYGRTDDDKGMNVYVTSD